MVNQPSETDISGAMNAWKQGRCEFSLNLILILAYTDAAIWTENLPSMDSCYKKQLTQSLEASVHGCVPCMLVTILPKSILQSISIVFFPWIFFGYIGAPKLF
jgi:hypothetical protein